jgi:hypothetical protein
VAAASITVVVVVVVVAVLLGRCGCDGSSDGKTKPEKSSGTWLSNGPENGASSTSGKILVDELLDNGPCVIELSFTPLPLPWP